MAVEDNDSPTRMGFQSRCPAGGKLGREIIVESFCAIADANEVVLRYEVPYVSFQTIHPHECSYHPALTYLADKTQARFRPTILFVNRFTHWKQTASDESKLDDLPHSQDSVGFHEQFCFILFDAFQGFTSNNGPVRMHD